MTAFTLQEAPDASTAGIARPGSRIHGFNERQEFAAPECWHGKATSVPRGDGTIVHLPLEPVSSLAARQSGWVDPQKHFIKPMEK
ncbi:hypothetical protein [Thioclava sp. A2]|uniref:hypothetical protein n=1 Tax=Thioclava sp. FCG-A2 TaxID=3080562 RepID=UPI0029538D54|nr:hypothetical protein [Thioclava sp. A2]